MKKLFVTPEIEIILLNTEAIMDEGESNNGNDYELGEDELPPF